jgi:hypothetical protein
VGSRRRPLLLAAALFVLAADLAILGSRVGDDDAGDGPPPAEALLEAYRRSRLATFTVERTFTRTFPDGRSFSYDQRLTQQPPDDRLLVGAGAASGRLDGRIVRCGTEPSGASRCFEGSEARPWDEEVDDEVADLASLVSGSSTAYDVTAGPDPGCFTLTLVQEVLAPPYGERAVFCFDDATGAPSRFELHRAEASDVLVAVEIRPEVVPADLRPGELGDLVTG